MTSHTTDPRTFQDYLERVEQLIDEGRQQLQPHDWTMVRRWLVGTPLELGPSAQQRWAARTIIAHYWPLLSAEDQAAFIQQQDVTSTPTTTEDAP